MADTGFTLPTTATETLGEWAVGSQTIAEFYNDTDYTLPTTNAGSTVEAELTDHGYSIPSGATIDGIEVEVSGLDSANDGSYNVNVSLSWDGGTTFTSTKAILSSSNFTNVQTEFTAGGAADTWGRTWSDTEFSDANFVVLYSVVSDSFPEEIRTYHVKTKVYYTEAGSPPSISTVTNPTVRGAAFTVTGTDFGATQGSSTLEVSNDGTTWITLTGLTWGDTSITGTIPASLALQHSTTFRYRVTVV